MSDGSSLVIPWAEALAGAWTTNYTARPCADGVLSFGRAFPGWRDGSSLPTWAEVIDCPTISAYDLRWLVARVLLRDRALPLEWVRLSTFVHIDAQIERWPDVGDDVQAVRGELLAWADGSIERAASELREVRDHADDDAAYAAAAYAADAAYAAADADAYAAADAAAYAAYAAVYADAERMTLRLALPLLDRAMAVRP